MRDKMKRKSNKVKMEKKIQRDYECSEISDQREIYHMFNTNLSFMDDSILSQKDRYIMANVYHIRDCTVVVKCPMNDYEGRIRIYGRKETIPRAISYIEKMLNIKLEEVK